MTHSLLTDLLASDPTIRETALFRALAHDGQPGGEAICAAVADQLRSDNFLHRELAAEALVALDCRCASQLPRLIDALGDDSAIVRERLLVLLRDYPLDPAAKNRLRGLLTDPADRVAIEAARALWQHDHDARAIQEALLRGLLSTDRSCLVAACQLAGEVVAAKNDLVARLRDLTRDADCYVRGNALHALYRLGEDTTILRSVLDDMKIDEDPYVRYLVSRIEKELVSPTGDR